MHDRMMFEAGRIASQRSWASPEIIGLDEIAGLPPSGPPIIAIGKACDVELPVVQAIAALAGASREIALITEQPLTDDLIAWLPANTNHVLGAPLVLDNESSHHLSTASDKEQQVTSPPSTAGGAIRYCTFLESDSLAPLRPAQDGWVLEAWKEFVHRHSLSLTDQGRGDQMSAGSWRVGDEDYGSPLWFQPMRRADDDAEFMLIGSTIGVVDKTDTQVAVTGSDWQKQFADQVVSWCEQPGATALLNQVMGRFGAQTAPLGQRKGADECFTTPTGSGGPDRILITDDSDEILVWTSPTDSTLISIAAASRILVFIYRIPAYRDVEVFDDVLCHAIDSLVRIHELLSNPASALDGRRDNRLSEQLEQFLRSSGIVSYGALARMERAREIAQYTGSPSIPEGQDLSRVSAIVAEAMEALRDNPDPGWQRLLEYGDLGFPAAVTYQKQGRWPTPQERAAIEDVYRLLCQLLALDTQREWVTFNEMVNTSITAQQQHPPAHDPVMPHDFGALICDKCGSPAEAGDQFCGNCGGAL